MGLENIFYAALRVNWNLWPGRRIATFPISALRMKIRPTSQGCKSGRSNLLALFSRAAGQCSRVAVTGVPGIPSTAHRSRRAV
jgi:hypothetical protein